MRVRGESSRRSAETAIPALAQVHVTTSRSDGQRSAILGAGPAWSRASAAARWGQGCRRGLIAVRTFCGSLSARKKVPRRRSSISAAWCSRYSLISVSIEGESENQEVFHPAVGDGERWRGDDELLLH